MAQSNKPKKTPTKDPKEPTGKQGKQSHQPKAAQRAALQDMTTTTNNEASMTMEEALAKLQEAEARNKELERKLASPAEEATPAANVTAAAANTPTQRTPAIPSATTQGAQGKIFRDRTVNLQEAMGLKKNRLKYKAIARMTKDILSVSGMNWELPWAEIPAREKAKLFQAVREQIPEMKKYANDWATEEIVRQLMKNRRGWCYKKGYLEVDEKWAHLKNNAVKRTDAPRGNGRVNAAAGPSRLKATQLATGSKRKAASILANPKAKTKKRTTTSSRKGKERARTPESDEEEEEEEESGSDNDVGGEED